jgi:hypothetical protein
MLALQDVGGGVGAAIVGGDGAVYVVILAEALLDAGHIQLDVGEALTQVRVSSATLTSPWRRWLATWPHLAASSTPPLAAIMTFPELRTVLSIDHAAARLQLTACLKG